MWQRYATRHDADATGDFRFYAGVQSWISTQRLGAIMSGWVSSTGWNINLASPGPIGSTTPSSGAFTTLSASSTVSGTGFSNYLASPPAIGGTAAAAGSFTTLSASSTVSGTGFSNYLASPPAIGGTAAAAGSFTNLSASGTVSGTGFNNYLASPPAIGGTAAAAGSFTTLNASSDITVTGADVIIGTAGKGIDFSAVTPSAGVTNQILTQYEEGTWTPNQGSGLTVVGAFTSNGIYTKIGRFINVSGSVSGATSIAVSAVGQICDNLPFVKNGQSIATGNVVDSSLSLSSALAVGGAVLYSVNAINLGASLYFSVVYAAD